MFSNFSGDTNIPIPPTDDSGAVNQFVTSIVDDSEESKNKKDIFRTVLITVVIFTVLLAVGQFVYAGYLEGLISSEKDKLSNIDSNLGVSFFEDNLDKMREMSQKLKLLDSVNSSRIYISGMLFPLLERVVESQRDSYVYFNRFDLQKNKETTENGDNNNNSIKITLSGVALDLPALYRQVTTFKSETRFKNFKLDSMSLNDKGNALFNVSFDVDISEKMYVEYLKNEMSNSNLLQTGVSGGPLFNRQKSVSVISNTQASSSFVNPITPATPNTENNNLLNNSNLNSNTQNSQTINIQNPIPQTTDSSQSVNNSSNASSSNIR